jgi:hypothetical protein
MQLLGKTGLNVSVPGQDWPERISSDNDPLFQYHRWKANLRVLDIEEIKSVPHVPMSHPFVERLIGSLRRELLDHTFFWTATDLEKKLRHYQDYYNEHRCHSSRDCKTQLNPVAIRWSISAATDGRNIVAAYFSFQFQHKSPFRQGQADSSQLKHLPVTVSPPPETQKPAK